MAAKAKTKTKSLSWYKKELDRVFSIYIRIRDKGLCFTCGDKKDWKYQQCGHYVSRVWLSLRYDEKNCNCQCPGCNVFKGGNMDEYAIRLVEKYGKNILKQLNQKKYQVVRYTPEWYEAQIKRYKQKVKKLDPYLKI